MHSVPPFESFAFFNLGYETYRELGPGEVVFLTPESAETLVKPRGGNEDLFLPVGILWISHLYL